MKILFLSLFICVFSLSVFGNHAEALKKANALYAAEKYDEAFTEYSKIESAGYESGALYFNMGNTCYRKSDFGQAVYYFEKAKLLLPGDVDVLHNLELTKLQIYDKITPVPQAAVVRLYKNFIGGFSANFWALFSLSAFALMLISLALYLFGKVKKHKVWGFSLASIFFLFSLVSFVFSQHRFQERINPSAGVILQESVTVRSAPDAESTDLFIIHEGLKVFVDEHKDNWLEISLEDGRVGWIRKDAIRLL